MGNPGFACWLTVNRICNYRCPWCYAEGTQYQAKDSMTLEYAQKMMRFLKEIGTDEIFFIGGEPLLWPHILEANDFAHQLGMSTFLVTNGSKFSDEEFFKKFQESPFDHIGLSIKAGNAKQHREITGRDDFTDFLRIITKLKNSGMPFSGSIVLSNLLAKNLVECVTSAVNAGIPFMNIDMCSPSITNAEINADLMVHPQESAELIKKSYNALHQITNGHFAVHVSTPMCLWDHDLLELMKSRNQVVSSCLVFDRSGLIFDPEGYLLPCNSLHDIKIGQFEVDFHDKKTFEIYWEEAFPAQFNRKITALPLESCGACADYTFCAGGCPLNWFVYNPIDIIPSNRR